MLACGFSLGFNEYETFALKKKNNPCHLALHSDTLVGQYFSAVLRVWNVSPFSIQLYRRASPRVGSFISKKENGIPNPW